MSAFDEIRKKRSSSSAFDEIKRKRSVISLEDEEKSRRIDPELTRFTTQNVAQDPSQMVQSATDRFRSSVQSSEPVQEQNKSLGTIRLAGQEFEVADYSDLPSREMPVVGPLLKLGDKISEKILPASKIGGEVYAPGLGLGPLSAMTSTAERTVGLGAGRLVESQLGQRALGAANKVLNTQGVNISPQLASKAVQLGAAEAAIGAPIGAMMGAANDGDAKDIALSTLAGAGIGAAGGAAMSVAGEGLRYAFGKLFQRSGNSEAARATEEILALPAPKEPVKTTGAPVDTPEVIYAGAAPTRTRVEQKANPYRQKYERLIEQAKTQNFTPGRELEELEELWSRMADRTDPGLDQLIDLAYPRQRTVTPEGLQRGKMKQAAGLGPNVERNLRPHIQPDPTIRPEQETLNNRPKAAPENARATKDPTSDSLIRVTEATPSGEVEKITPFVPDAPIVTKQSLHETLFGDQGVGIVAGQGKARELIDTHIVDNKTTPTSLLQATKEGLSNANQSIVDQFAPFKLVSPKAYDAAMDSTRANNLTHIALSDAFVDLQGVVKGNSLKGVYDNVPRGQRDLAHRYLILRDSVDRMNRGIRVFPDAPWAPKTADQAKEMYEALEAKNPWLARFGQEWNSFNKNVQDLWLDGDLVSDQTLLRLRRSNPNYAKMARQMDPIELRKSLSGKRGFSGQSAGVMSAKGSARKIVDPSQGMIESVNRTYSAVLRNRAMKEIYEAVIENPDRFKGVIETIDTVDTVKNDALDKINEMLQKGDIDGVVDMLNDEITNIFKHSRVDKSQKGATVTIMIGGNPVKMKVLDPSILKAIEGITPDELSGALKVVDFLSKATKYSATGALAPLQGAKLFIRDLPIAAAQSKDKKRFIQDVTYAMISQIADWLPSYIPGAKNMGKLARDYYRAGGGYEAYLKGDSGVRTKSFELTKDPIFSSRNLAKVAKNVANPFRPLQGFSNALENIPRIAAFNAEMRKIKWSRDPESIRRALEAGREATVNWSRKGARTRTTEALLPYSNAAVQGTYRLVKRFKEQPVSASLLIMGIAGAQIQAYERFKDDPDYQYRSRYAQGIPIAKTEDGKFITIPVEPTEKFIADQIFDFYRWSQGDMNQPTAKERIQQGADALLPGYGSAAVSAFTSPDKKVDLKSAASKLLSSSSLEGVRSLDTGQNFFGGDIVPREYQSLPTELQYNETTSSAGKWAAENLGMDAFTFDYLAEKYGGDLAKIALPMTSDVGKGDPLGNIESEVLARLRLLEDPTMSNRISEDYYRFADRVTNAKAAYDRHKVAPPEWLGPAYNNITSQRKNSIASRISDLNAIKKQVQRDTTLSAKERSEQLREVQTQINLMRIQAIEYMEQIGVPK